MFFSLFSTSFRFSQKEEGIWKKVSRRKNTHHRVSNWSLSLLCSIVFIFSKRKCISKSWGKLINYKPDNRIPSLFTDFDNIKDFPWLFKKFTDFSLTLKKFSFFPDFSLTVATLSTVNSLYSGHLLDRYLVSVCHLRWGRLIERDLPHTKGQLTWKGEDPSTSKMLEGGPSWRHVFSVFSLHAKGCACP